MKNLPQKKADQMLFNGLANCENLMLRNSPFVVARHGKSVLQPCQKLAFLGFLLDSVHMKVFPTAEKREKIILAYQQLLKKSVFFIRKVAHVIGLLHYRSLEIDKNTPLQQNNGNYEAIMTLSSESVNDLSWWVTSLPIAWKILPWAT